MQVLYLLIPLGIVLVSFAGAALVWALYSGQYDQLDVQSDQLPDQD